MSATATGLAPAAIENEASIRTSWLSPALTAVYVSLVTWTVIHHEPWSDEAQAWLLARDSSLSNLWLHLMHYEGSPPIWQTFLHIVVKSGMPYAAYGFLSAAVAFAGVWILMRHAPFPLWARLTLPFTYYLCYQYAVIARSYVLFAPLLFAAAYMFDQARKKPFVFAGLLCLIAAISVHGVVIASAIWLAAFAPLLVELRGVQKSESRRIVAASAMYCLILCVLMLAAWPAKDVAFAENRGLGNLHFFASVSKATLAGAFTGDWITSVAMIALTIPFLYRGGGLFFFLLVNAILLVFGTLVYAQLWHFGIFLLVWIFAIWISALRTPWTVPVTIALGVVIACQCSWTAQSIAFDWDQPYSGSLEAVRYFRSAGIQPGQVYAVGYSCTALQPYYSKNIYSDYDKGGPAAYWDWSKRNRANDPSALFSSRQRDFVLVGYKAVWEASHWNSLLLLLGYEKMRHFEGKLFWQTGPFELESYDLYRRSASGPSFEASSVLDMAKPASELQLLSGFYNVEMNAWRWTSKNFSAALKPPAGASAGGGKLLLKLYFSPEQIRALGPVTLRADVDGHVLPMQKFSKDGLFTYTADVPADALHSTLVTANFALDKALAATKGDGRELGAVVTSVALEATKP